MSGERYGKQATQSVTANERQWTRMSGGSEPNGLTRPEGYATSACGAPMRGLGKGTSSSGNWRPLAVVAGKSAADVRAAPAAHRWGGFNHGLHGPHGRLVNRRRRGAGPWSKGSMCGAQPGCWSSYCGERVRNCSRSSVHSSSEVVHSAYTEIPTGCFKAFPSREISAAFIPASALPSRSTRGT